MSIQVKVQNASVFGQEKTLLTAAATAADTTLTVDSTVGFSANDYIVVGTEGNDTTELIQITSVDDDTTMTIPALDFNHELSSKIQKSNYNQALLYSYSDTSGTAETLIDTQTIDFQNYLNITLMTDTGSSSGLYYRVIFKNSTTSATSDYSAYLDGDTTKYCTIESVYQKCGLDETVVPFSTALIAIQQAESTVEAMYKTTFGSIQTQTVYLNGEDDQTVFIPYRYLPLVSVTELVQLDATGATANTFSSDDYQFDENGMIKLRASMSDLSQFRFFYAGFQNVKVTFTAGYSSVPSWVCTMVRLMAGLSVVNYKETSSYTDVSTWSDEGMSYSLGQPYVNLDSGLRRMLDELNRLIAVHKPVFMDDYGS